MKLAVTLFHQNDIKQLVEDAQVDIFIIGNEKYANRLVKSFTEIEIGSIVEEIKSYNKEIYLQMNLIVHNDDIPKVVEYLNFANNLEVDGILFSDLAIYNLAKKQGLEKFLIYNPDTLNTNYHDPIFWNKKGIKGVTISKEITLKEIKEITEKSNIETSIIGHGHLNMFHSRRPLIENFFKFNKKEYDQYVENRNLTLVEEIRNESYPVFQDKHGTHIFRDNIMKSYVEAKELNDSIDVFIIDGIFKDSNYLLETATNYRKILNDSGSKLPIKIDKKYDKGHDSGFLYKKTV
jgi:putative protease